MSAKTFIFGLAALLLVSSISIVFAEEISQHDRAYHDGSAQRFAGYG